ncbi:MAG: Peptide methionine sulfoxide reductase [Candidatus Amesbacteria bacterium GW2011_GWA1_47_16]|uniref:Peptide methionine sulfoxide reductase MsrA n=3 Tax=Candidatus Amesiibacteriota TaxID=1752730 RepID=A0A1F4ZX76_9BACT|nr:MAG: Peptide methionine sulfoxide reductase [Candidatus Amesbacteria bacterium GW2011_GWC1_47_15]KKU64182.1 MAG: Peptide methionine sulfoxide reductase [Candidatus Amesbacteria bacterium GW2011_GWA1_47_16]OGD10057.1 MAG: peptide-methionine (S)-S-oxide reductase [Candidatus Amesbacteria bacterium RIFOXYB1_FULL_47_9]
MTEKATLAGGCFWCTEAIFRRIKGVLSVTPGYSGGTTENPTYEQVSSGESWHAEAIQIEFDPEKISFEKLLEIFFHTHDPTALNRQGADTGPQYRSAVFYHNEAQKKQTEKMIKNLNQTDVFGQKIVTEVTPFINFFPAEESHLEYYEKNRNAPYCRVVIDPKIRKLLAEYREDLKPEMVK